MAEMTKELTDLLGVTGAAMEGEDILRLEIKRDTEFRFLHADQVAIARASNDTIDLMFVVAASRSLHQSMAIQEKTDAGMTLGGGAIQMVPDLTEVGGVRLPAETALEVAMFVLNMARDGGREDDVRARLTAQGWL